MNDIKVDSRVMVISDCMTNGCVGTVSRIDRFYDEAIVKLDSTPSFYRGSGTGRYNLNSLKLIPDVKNITKSENDFDIPQGTKKVFGIFYRDGIGSGRETGELMEDGYLFPSDASGVMIVHAYTPQHCIKLLEKAIVDDDVDSDYYTHLVFGTWVYKLNQIMRIELEDVSNQ